MREHSLTLADQDPKRFLIFKPDSNHLIIIFFITESIALVN
jgi:hypothetical protein